MHQVLLTRYVGMWHGRLGSWRESFQGDGPFLNESPQIRTKYESSYDPQERDNCVRSEQAYHTPAQWLYNHRHNTLHTSHHP